MPAVHDGGIEEERAPARSSDAAAPSTAPLLELRGLRKAFDSVQAVDGVSLRIAAGEVHALLGGNGAGKSTVIRMLAGAVRPDEGEIVVDGRPVEIGGPQDATALGFQFLHQELNLVPTFTALQNMALGLVGRGRSGLADWRPARARARAVAAQLGIGFDLERRAATLSVADQWLVALGRSLMRDARLIALDEPTGSLSARETEALFAIVRALARDGVAVLYVSHRLEEIEALCDRATVFRDGRVVVRMRREQLVREQLIAAITGAEAQAITVPAATEAPSGPVVLACRGLRRGHVVRDVSLEVRAGEVLGLAGLVGSGRTEVARLLFGADRPDGGEILLDGAPVALRGPAHASRLGIAMVPEERRSQALVLDRSAAFNLNLAFPRGQRISRAVPLVSPRRARRRAAAVGERVALEPRRVDLPIRHYSGGNQQKVALGRWLLGRVRVLLLDEPTRGVDVGARAQIHRLMRGFAEEGMALIVISSDFEELLGCDRVLVMAHGRVVEQLTGAAISEERMLRGAYAVPDLPTTASTGG